MLAAARTQQWRRASIKRAKGSRSARTGAHMQRRRRTRVKRAKGSYSVRSSARTRQWRGRAREARKRQPQHARACSDGRGCAQAREEQPQRTQ
eukprot:2489149-Pleurochrysis_carterae.AAC.1